MTLFWVVKEDQTILGPFLSLSQALQHNAVGTRILSIDAVDWTKQLRQ